MRCPLLLIALLFFSPAESHGTLRFAVYEPGFPPFIYIEEKQHKITGIVPKLLTSFTQQQSLSIEYVMDNRKGGEQRLYDGNVDAMLISPEWAKHPDQLLFTQAILPYDDYLFQRDTQEAPENTSVTGKSVCTREYYVYPVLEKAFETKTMLRLDASSQQAQLRMLEKSRCDFAYINELVAYWLVERHFPGLRITPVSDYKASTSLKIALHPRWHTHLPALNAFIQAQRESGELDKIVAQFVISKQK
ncbi:substrate-binding periplasmic protein [Lacimicrobium alkaliphilum]|uniref:Solute-binding protein family 3/N-terminal domain-containing protein n=1 Tax=Lacimicrobium alkaliphilum TaxID=1526571 RepID=A0A0U2PJ80_9ALTE|nr:transporter substrate-binding domain-containing protein [Lacimicrobium alkaliphilum]ALS99581.1 hypothetical protein AT746_15825 [Lacimicrobium alkaliphilum]